MGWGVWICGRYCLTEFLDVLDGGRRRFLLGCADRGATGVS